MKAGTKYGLNRLGVTGYNMIIWECNVNILIGKLKDNSLLKSPEIERLNASLFKPGEEYKTLALPCGQPQPAGGHADYVIKDGKQIGYSSGTTYSYYYREVISHCTINIDQTLIGNEVIVQWGDYGKRIKEVRATVERYPYLDLPRNKCQRLHLQSIVMHYEKVEVLADF